jgi:hypothetical protein
MNRPVPIQAIHESPLQFKQQIIYPYIFWRQWPIKTITTIYTSNHNQLPEPLFMTIHFLAANEPLIVDGKPRLGYFDDALPIINTL